MANTGYKGWTMLEEYDIETGELTGNTKPNSIGDPNYFAPVQDLDMCPVRSYSATMGISIDSRVEGNTTYGNFIISASNDIIEDITVNVELTNRGLISTRTVVVSASTNRWESGEIAFTPSTSDYRYGYKLLNGQGYSVSNTDSEAYLFINSTDGTGGSTPGGQTGVEPA